MANWFPGDTNDQSNIKVTNSGVIEKILNKQKIKDCWKPLIKQALNDNKGKLIDFCKEVKKCVKSGDKIFPLPENVFAFATALDISDIKIVLLGQDPYIKEVHLLELNDRGEKRVIQIPQAHGFSFSVPKGASPPPSLKNIFKELQQEYTNFVVPNDGNLDTWTSRGILLLNSSLTVKEGVSNSHKIFWEIITDRIIELLCEKTKGFVFLLLGTEAQKKESKISNGHHIVKAGHPSPVNTSGNFLGSGCFKKCDDYLSSPMNWML